MATFPDKDIPITIGSKEFDVVFNIDTYDDRTAEIWNLQIIEDGDYRDASDVEFCLIVGHLEAKGQDLLNNIIDQPVKYSFETKLPKLPEVSMLEAA